MTHHRAFEPAVAANTRLLVLGSLPGRASLAARRYYAHPRNLFWRLVGTAIGHDFEQLEYDKRLQTLLTAGVGLWDTLASARREGSLDSAIRDGQPADLATLAALLPELRAIAFNGRKAATIGRRQLDTSGGLTFIELPSSSPAYASMPFVEKQRRWMALRDFVGDALPSRGPVRMEAA